MNLPGLPPATFPADPVEPVEPGQADQAREPDQILVADTATADALLLAEYGRRNAVS